MATIRTAIQVDDRMSGAFRAMNNALNIVINSFADLQDATHNAVDVSSIQAARTELARAESAFNQIESSIQGATQQQEQFNRTVTNGGNAMGGLMGKVKSLVGAYVGMRAIGGGMDATDTYTSNNARLELINDGLQTQAELQDKIFAAAQRSRGQYDAMVNTVAKLGLLAGKNFSSNDELIAFTELMNKSFKISGADATESANAMYQLTQAMASGRLQGDEFRSIIENAPMLANAIAEYTGVGQEGLKELSSDGAISADIIKASLFSVAKDIEDKYSKLPLTFGDIWTDIKNTVEKSATDVMQKVNGFINSDTGVQVVNGIKYALVGLVSVLGVVVGMVENTASFFIDNWSMIEPVIGGVAFAMGIYTAAIVANNIANGIRKTLEIASCLASYAHAAATRTEASQTAMATAAQYGLNTALLACPITWIVVGIVAIIAIIYAVVAAINHFAGTSYSATGIIAGAFMALGAHILNTFLIPVWNHVVAFINFFANVWNDPVAAVQVLFYDMCLNVIGYITNMASAIEDVINKIPGVNVDITSGLDNFQQKIEDASAKVKSESEWKEYVKKIDYIDYGAAYNKGYDFGEGIDSKLDSMFNFEMPDYEDSTPDYSSLLGDMGSGLGDIADSIGKTADNTDTSTEDLKYLRDIAERETINRFTTAEIKVDMGGVNNTVTKMNDLDGIADYLAVKVEEQMQIAAEGVHE